MKTNTRQAVLREPMLAQEIRLQVEALANRKTYGKARQEHAGWSFSPTVLVYEPRIGAYELRGSFTCVCGRTEQYRLTWMSNQLERAVQSSDLRWLADQCDVVARLADSFSEKHLLADGYSQEQVRQIMGKLLEFDLQAMEHLRTQGVLGEVLRSLPPELMRSLYQKTVIEHDREGLQLIAQEMFG